MFTGIIQHLGTIVSCECIAGQRYKLIVSSSIDALEAGESIAINGVCLTVLPGSTSASMTFDISPETAQLTTLSQLKVQDVVHVERALMANDRVGGHFVTGHVEAMLTLKSKVWRDDCLEMVWDGVSAEMQNYLFPKGCIAISGVSLTVNEVHKGAFSVMLIPHTLENTQLKSIEVGQKANVEFDYFAKMIAQQMKQMSLSINSALTSPAQAVSHV